jgi:uncharacterized protein YkwD
MMKYHFLGTFCVCLTVIGVTATAHADLSTSIPTNRSIGLPNISSPASSQLYGNRQSKLTAAMNSLELATFTQVNQYRQSQNLPPLVCDPAISAQAKAHSEAMARTGSLSHEGFNERVDSISATITYQSAAENLASNLGYAQPDLIAVQGWIDSPGHHHNMVGRYDLTGIGVAKSAKGEYYFTQIFVRKPN